LAVRDISVWRAVGLEKHVTVVMQVDEEEEEEIYRERILDRLREGETHLDISLVSLEHVR
jgi:hypothetical protein